MYLGINTVGNLTREPETKTSRNGNEYITCGMAVNDYQRGEEKTHWLNITAMDPRTMRVLGSAKKGSLVAISGTFDIRAYLDKSDNPAASIDVILSNIGFVSAGRRDDTNTTRTPVAAGNWDDQDIPF